MKGNTCLLLLLVLNVVNCKNISDSCDVLYKKGVEAYLENRFEDCVYYFEDSVEKYKVYNKKIQNCRLKCHEEAAFSEPLYYFDVENLRYYEQTIKNTLCIIKCRNYDKDVFNEFNLDAATVKIFEDRKPYEYLHVCYAQIGDPQRATSAAFTYLVTNPNDDVMLKNLRYYTELPEVNKADIINYEAKDYVYLYVHGTNSYETKSWQEVIRNMEESLLSYLQAEEECRAQCEGPFNQGWYPDFIPSIANHFTHSLRCKRKCKDKLSTLNGEKHDDLYPSHYHYLQYAYFKVGNIKAACEAVSSYLLFFPHDDTMLYNMEYYKKMPKVQEDSFKARPEALHYMHRNNYEENLMMYIFSAFTEETISRKAKLRALCNNKKSQKRFVLDDFVNLDACQALMQIAKNFSVVGDGYATSTPHTINEEYKGLTLKRAGFLVQTKKLDQELLELVLRIRDDVKAKILSEFGVSKRLYFTFTHLVCRTARSGAQYNRSDFSHAVHADNCNIQVDGSCPKKSPAFTWRDYTAILYLNHDFSGGELFFAMDLFGKNIQEVIQPTCGRLVGFTSGSENLHGVKAVRKGTRCALAIWFTFNERNFENERKIILQ